MSTGFKVLLAILLLGGVGFWVYQQNQNPLRLDDFSLRGSKTGLAAESGQTTFDSDEQFVLFFRVRGCKPDAERYFSADVKVTVEGSSPLIFYTVTGDAKGIPKLVDLRQSDFKFPWRSEMTSADHEAWAQGNTRAGKQVLVIHVHDKVSNRDVEKRLTFSVKGPDVAALKPQIDNRAKVYFP